MANLIFNQLPPELFVVIHNATKQLCKAKHWETEAADQLHPFLYALRSQGASHPLKTEAQPGIKLLRVCLSGLQGLALESIRGLQGSSQT